MDVNPKQETPVFVFDRMDEPVGSVVGWEREGSTGEPRGLALRLTPEAAEALGSAGQPLRIPSRDVFAMRRDRIVLDHTLDTLGPLARSKPSEEDPIRP